MKILPPEELLQELNICIEYMTGRVNGRNVRYLEDRGLLQIGEPDGEFDRWANSVELEFEIWKPKGQRQLRRWVEEVE